MGPFPNANVRAHPPLLSVLLMADVVVDNQQEPQRELSPAVKTDKGDVSEDNQTTHDKVVRFEEVTSDKHDNNDDEHEHETRPSEIRASDVDRRLTWIGEGLLDGEGLEAVQQFASLPSDDEVSTPKSAVSTDNDGVVTKERSMSSGSKLTDFLAKEDSFKGLSPPEAPRRPSPPKITKRESKLLDFLAVDVGERYLDDVYQDEDRDEPTEESSATPTSTPDQSPATKKNNKLLAFLARERGERFHEVEKPGVGPVAASGTSTPPQASSPPKSTQSTPAESKSRSKLLDFVGKAAENRPKFVIFNPDDLVSSSSSGSEGERSPTNRNELRLKNGSRQQVHGNHAGHDDHAGVYRQPVLDRYGREELLDFGPSSDVTTSQAPAEPEEAKPRRAPSPIPTPPQPVSTPAPKSDGRIAAFLRKFSSNSSPTRDPPAPRAQKFDTPPRMAARHSSPPTSSPAPKPTTRFERVMIEDRSSATSAPSSDDGSVSVPPAERSAESPSSLISLDSNSRRMSLIANMRQIVEDCEKNELSEISVVRISTLLASINQIVREDLRKERPAQRIYRRLSGNSPTPTNTTRPGRTASWVRSEQEQAEYEKGHVTTIADIADYVDKSDSEMDKVNNLVKAPKLHPIDGVVVAEGVMASLTAFEIGQNMDEILVAHRRLLKDCGMETAELHAPLKVYQQVKSCVYDQLSFRQKQLFRLLDTKLSMDAYHKQPCKGKRVCVVGAGPIGLRAAVELALLGAEVVVVDKRHAFSRENILHLWPWVVQDLTSLGAKVFFPQFCHSTAYFHVGTRQLQCILLKVALLLGVTMYQKTSFEGLAAPESIVSERRPFYTVVTKPQIPWMEFTAVLSACGTKDKLSTQAGIKRFVFSRKEAIGLVCYFPNQGTTEEKRVKEFSWTLQFKQQMFAKMRDIGIDLENVVYYRGEYHYLVMTPKRQNLIEQGVLKVNYPVVSDLVGVDNIDPSALNDYVSRVINFFEVPQKSEFARVRLFDFSARTRADKAANILSSRGKKLYVGLVGDALMEPFWPEGLGTCRGFLSAMDGCWMVSQIGKESDEQILADRELGYRIVQHISGFRREDLQKNVRRYSVDPSSRYTVRFPAPLSY
ncbi:hypothetical protein Poli38472_005103 [Pythium oligandrum]|uniref:FAD-binding domain-containing protein n=1 Tax=Pythium oligandrum TaxID=41045 RepID=A0A8K1CFY8_PYTOL|nr:hypothetical protein Poli38472_005103 [Pythium oligandrum]|eukprot:TMW62485.1 hypothetical protein Poli38472_005103 [Pythium oligandrum]